MKIGIIFLFLIALSIRFLWLDKFPVGMYHDEVEYILSAKSYGLRGVDISGFGFPISLFKTQTDGLISPVTPIMLAWFAVLVPLNQVSSRIPSVIANIITAFLIYFLVKEFFKRKKLALITSLIFLVNPWSFYLSRYIADSPFALMFMLSGIWGILKLRDHNLVWAFLFFAGSFFAYHGAKLIVLPVVFICLVYRAFAKYEHKLKLKQMGIFLGATIFLYILFFGISFIIADSALVERSGDLIFNDEKNISRVVDEGRRLSIESPFKGLFSNKTETIFSLAAQKYFTAFSADVLLFAGDLRSTYRFGEHGLFYLVDSIFILAGVLFMFKNNRKLFLFLFSLALVAPLSTAISRVETSVVHRSFLLLPVLTIFASYGIWEIVKLGKKEKVRVALGALVFLVILMSSLNFFYFYFFRFPVTSQESYFLSERIVARFLNLTNFQKAEVVSLSRADSRSRFLEAIFYLPKELQDGYLMKNYPAQGVFEYQIAGVSFVKGCPKELDKKTVYIISREVNNCGNNLGEKYSILDQKDSGEIFKIINSKFCEGFSRQGYRRFNNLEDYSVEGLSKENFCRAWVVKG